MRPGFCVLSCDQDVEFRFYGAPGSDRSALVTFCQFAGDAAAFMGRLYYRDDLLSRLDIGPEDGLGRQCRSNDAALALAAYRKLGSKGLAALEGDYALVIWDAGERRLIGLRDPLGGYPLFWSETKGTLALGTSLRPLLDLLPQRSLDQGYLAEFLARPGCYVEEHVTERCAFQGVRRVLAGTLLSARLPAGTVERHAYWNWREHMVAPGTNRLEDLGSQYGDLLRRAVRERLGECTASHLSGGMDSTTVALMAREWLAAHAGAPPLHALSLVYQRLPGLAREAPYLESVLSQDGLVAHRVPADELLNFDCFADAPLHEEPWSSLMGMGTDRALVDAAVRAGATTVLTGHGADHLLTAQPFHLTDLLRRGRLRQAWRTAARWARAENCSVWQMLCPYGIRNLLPVWASDGLGTWLRGGYARWKNQGDYTIPPWILPGFARRHGLRHLALDNLRHTYRACRPTGLSAALAAIGHRTGDCSRWYLAAPRGVALAHPYLDTRVVGFCLGLQRDIEPEPGHHKPLLAEATRGLLPDAIRNRSRKGHFNEVYFLGLGRNLPQLEALVYQAPVEDLGLVDKQVLLRCLHQAAVGIACGAAGLDRLHLTLALLKWLTMLRDWPRNTESPTQVIRMNPWSPEP
jgi:asparagine synthase (glutamine-hydrolysing)